MSSDLALMSEKDRVAYWLRVVSIDGRPVTVMKWLWDKLDALYPQKWASHFRTAEKVAVWERTWAESFAEDGVTGDEVRVALKALRCGPAASDWPPSYPEFIRACRPPLDYEATFAEAAEQLALRHRDGSDSWSSPAVFWAATRIGGDVRALPYPVMKGRWIAALDVAVRKVRAGELPAEVPAAALALPAPADATVPVEVARERAAALQAMLAGLARNMAMPQETAQ